MNSTISIIAIIFTLLSCTSNNKPTKFSTQTTQNNITKNKFIPNANRNPKLNANINPTLNANFEGFYFFDLNLNSNKIVITTNKNKVLLIFDTSFEFIEYGIHNNNNGYNLFDLNHQWIGHLQSDSKKGYLYFDLNNKWVGFLN
jgi:hypothetical protein